MRRLYFRIYLAVLGSLVVFAILAGAAGVMLRAFDEEDRRDVFAMGANVAERMLAAERGAKALGAELDLWNQLTGFDVMLVSPLGNVIAAAGEMPSRVLEDFRKGRRFGARWRHGGRIFRIRLRDGRWLIARRPPGAFEALRHLRWIAALLGIALAVGVAAWPVVRQLTRRLERLQQGVAAFGEGNLSARVAVSGRDEIATLAETFNASAARIEQLMAAHKALLANASHELRSPLSRLRMAIERLEADSAGEARAEITRNIAELDALVGEILMASRLQAGAGPDLVRESLDLLGLIAEECAPYGAELSVSGEAPPPMEGDARLLRRLFRNLLENAVRHGGAGDEPPAVTARRDAGMIVVAVCDRGPGIPEDERERIFEPFHRLRNVPESAGGTGLGLSLVRQIAERHGGSVRCTGREGGGTCFTVRLPLAARACR